MAGHDPSNNRVLDLSGNGRHLTLGNGAGANEPTKLTDKRGYRTVAEGDRMELAGFTQWTAGTITVEALIGGNIKSIFSGAADVVGLFGAGACNFIINLSGTQVVFFSGGTAGGNIATLPVSSLIDSLPVMHVVGRHDGTNTNVWVNGGKSANAGTPLAPNSGNTGSALRLFSRYNNTRACGSIFVSRIWDRPLSDIEIQELNRRAKRELHRI